MGEGGEGSSFIRTPDQHLRVFVSSTLGELAEEREAVRQGLLALRVVPVMFEAGARPHPAQTLYRAYLAQSHVFLGIYWKSYGWIGPGMTVSGLEDEYRLSGAKPRLIYIKDPLAERHERLTALLDRIRDDDTCTYVYFETTEELRERVENDVIVLLTELFEAGRSERPPAAEAIVLQARAPSPPTPLMGREEELAAVSRLLLEPDTRLVTLTGTGGTGKTRLAIEMAHKLASRFPDGVSFVSLESVADPDLVLPTIGDALGLSPGSSGGGPAEQLRAFLGEKNALLILDNFEHLLDAAGEVASLLESCPHLKIMATSRAPLRIRAERLFSVPPLLLPPAGRSLEPARLFGYSAVRLFVERARAARPGLVIGEADAPVIAEICRRLEGLPLAIELAASRSRLYSPQTLFERLERRFELLRGGPRDLPKRQQTMSDAVDWSYGLLNEPERAVLRRLTVFASSWTLEAAEVVCALPTDLGLDVLQALEALVDNCLVKPPEDVGGETRYRMLETIREFAAGRLVANGEDEELGSRHAAYFLDMAESAEAGLHGPAHDSWSRRLADDLDNLRAAIKWGIEHAQPEGALRAVCGLWMFWEGHGHSREGVEWLERGLSAAGEVAPAVRAMALTRQAWLLRPFGDRSRVMELYRTSLAIWRQLGDERGLALTLSNFGAAMMHQGDYDSATESLEEALALRRRLGETARLYATLLNLGLVKWEQGRLEQALELYDESLHRAREAGDDLHVGLVMVNRAELLTSQGLYDQAEESLAEVALIHSRHGDRWREGYARYSQAFLAWRKGDPTGARDILLEAIRLMEEAGDLEHAIPSLELLAQVLCDLGDCVRAARLLAAGDSLGRGRGLGRPAVHQRHCDSCRARLAEELGEDGFAVAWQEGASMSLSEALALALADPAPHPPVGSVRI
jgi:predicted ATPase